MTSESLEEITIEPLPEDYAQYDLSFKIIVIGDSGVGKSCLTSKAVKNMFIEFYQATIGFEFLTYNLKMNDTIVKLQIWDTCGQEVYRSLISNFYRNSSLAILIYAINNKESFNNTEYWLKDLKNEANNDIRIMLIGNKCDLENERVISKDEGENFKDENNIDCFMETSAKTGVNAKNCIHEAAKILYRDYLNNKIKGSISENNNNDSKLKNLGDKINVKGTRKCC
jgi:Ras-related protein Rab-1A